MSTSEKGQNFVISNRAFNKLSNDTQFLKLKWYFWKYNFYKVCISFSFTKYVFPFIFFIFAIILFIILE